MKRNLIIAAGAVILLAAGAQAQTPPDSRTKQIEQEQAQKAKKAAPARPNFLERTFLDIEEHGGFLAPRPISVAFGGIKAGSGIALGLASGHLFPSGDVFEVRAVGSIRKYWLVQAAAASRDLAEGRLKFSGRLRLQDAPQVAFYGIGPSTPKVRSDYDERKGEISGQAVAQPVRFVRLIGGLEYAQYTIGSGTSRRSSVEQVYSPLEVPGLGADPHYLHSFALLALDSRTSTSYSRSGSYLAAVLHDFNERKNLPYSFRETEFIAQQLVPVLQGNWVFDFAAHVWTTSTSGGNSVPFFLMPTLGGSDYLRGYADYRFRDRHALLLTGQYRWYVQEFVDGVIFYDMGKVASTRGDLDLKHLKRDFGVGVNFHSPDVTVLRLQIAHGREGNRLILAFTPPAF
jgi:surface antigen Omp85-like protein